MNNHDILRIAMEQSAIDAGCQAQDFCLDTNKVVLSVQNSNARKYLDLPFFCDLISYGSNIVASVDNRIKAPITSYINKFPYYHCFEPPYIYTLRPILKQYDMEFCHMAEYFLPDMNQLQTLPCPYPIKLLYPKDFAHLYDFTWGNALCKTRSHLDVLAAGAYDGDTLIGLAGCSADCDTMWQIGIDVLPDYRRKGIASALTSVLALETLRRGKVPFYCCAWSNIRSVRNAVRCGFRPAWVELTAKNRAFAEEICTCEMEGDCSTVKQ